MIKKRSFGDILSPNVSRNCELSPELRAIIFGALKAGATPTEISRDFGVARRTVYNIKNMAQVNDKFTSKPRTGRPKSLTFRDCIDIKITVRRNPGITRKELREKLDLHVSDATIRRELLRQRL
jgi:transposase